MNKYTVSPGKQDVTVIFNSQSPQIITYGTNQSAVIDVSPINANSATPTGTVTLQDSNYTYDVASLNDGVATITLFNPNNPNNLFNAGNYDLYAYYSGDNNYNSGISSVFPLQVNQTSTNTSLAMPSLVSQNNEITANIIVSENIGIGIITGTVTLQVNNTTVESVNISGTLNVLTSLKVIQPLTITFTPTISGPYTAYYSGDGNNLASISNTIQLTVIQQSTITFNAPTTIFNGHDATVSAIVSTVNNIIPTGTIRFKVNGIAYNLVTLDRTGTASIVLSGLPVGSNTIAAVYSGDTNYSPSNNTTTITVIADTGSISINKKTNRKNIFAGEMADFTIIVQNNGSTVDNNVTLSDPLPGSDINWTIQHEHDSSLFTITGPIGSQILSTVSPVTLNPNQKISVRIVGKTNAADATTSVNTLFNNSNLSEYVIMQSCISNSISAPSGNNVTTTGISGSPPNLQPTANALNINNSIVFGNMGINNATVTASRFDYFSGNLDFAQPNTNQYKSSGFIIGPKNINYNSTTVQNANIQLLDIINEIPTSGNNIILGPKNQKIIATNGTPKQSTISSKVIYYIYNVTSYQITSRDTLTISFTPGKNITTLIPVVVFIFNNNVSLTGRVVLHNLNPDQVFWCLNGSTNSLVDSFNYQGVLTGSSISSINISNSILTGRFYPTNTNNLSINASIINTPQMTGILTNTATAIGDNTAPVTSTETINLKTFPFNIFETDPPVTIRRYVIAGTGFDPILSNNTVIATNNGNQIYSQVIAVTSNSITVSLPDGLQSGNLFITVITPSNITYNVSANLTPVITASTVPIGKCTKCLQINGFGFSSIPINNIVTFDNNLSNVVVKSTYKMLKVKLFDQPPFGPLNATVTVNNQISVPSTQVATVISDSEFKKIVKNTYCA